MTREDLARCQRLLEKRGGDRIKAALEYRGVMAGKLTRLGRPPCPGSLTALLGPSTRTTSPLRPFP